MAITLITTTGTIRASVALFSCWQALTALAHELAAVTFVDVVATALIGSVHAVFDIVADPQN
jgi:hypothetical protein